MTHPSRRQFLGIHPIRSAEYNNLIAKWSTPPGTG